jgi:hypothetical protein
MEILQTSERSAAERNVKKKFCTCINREKILILIKSNNVTLTSFVNLDNPVHQM